MSRTLVWYSLFGTLIDDPGQQDNRKRTLWAPIALFPCHLSSPAWTLMDDQGQHGRISHLLPPPLAWQTCLDTQVACWMKNCISLNDDRPVGALFFIFFYTWNSNRSLISVIMWVCSFSCHLNKLKFSHRSTLWPLACAGRRIDVIGVTLEHLTLPILHANWPKRAPHQPRPFPSGHLKCVTDNSPWHFSWHFCLFFRKTDPCQHFDR